MHETEQSKQQVIMVLAMARSGTSAITRGLKAIGIGLGDYMHKPDKRNPTGFWEDVDVTYRINRGLLRHLNYPWVCPSLGKKMQDGDDADLVKFKKYACHLVKERLGASKYWGFKDPNTTTLLPFWQSVLEEANVQDSYVIALRNPLGCAYSNIKHSNLELEAGLLEWLRNLILAVDGTHSKRRLVVSYDLLLQDPAKQLRRMARDLTPGVGADETEVEAYAKEFINHKLHHYSYTEEDLKTNQAMQAVPLCIKVYDLLMRLAKDELSFADSDFYTEWQEIKDDFEKYFPLYYYARTLIKENHITQRKLRVIAKSIPWRITYPLRVVENYFRQKRRLARKYKRLEKAYG